jgi:hypothetical protein
LISADKPAVSPLRASSAASSGSKGFESWDIVNWFFGV